MDWTDDFNALGRSAVLTESKLYELTLGGIRPKDVPKIRELVAATYARPAIANLIEPLLKTIEAMDRAALLALASMGDQDAILELGHFGKKTESDAAIALRALRNPLKPSLWKPIKGRKGVCSICCAKDVKIVSRKDVLGISSYACAACQGKL